MFKKIAAIALTGAAMSSASVAQDFGGAVSLGYGRVNVEDLDTNLSVFSLDGTFDLTFDSGLQLGGDISLNSLDIDDISESVGATSLGINGGYRLASGFSFGAYIERSSISVDDFDIDLRATSYGVTAGYDTETLTFSGFIGATNTDPDLPDGIDVTDFGLMATFQATPDLFLAGSFVSSKLSNGDDDINLNTFGIAAVYGINEEVSVFGGIGRSSLSDVDLDLTTFAIGVSYDLTKAINFPSTVSLELARSVGEFEDEATNLDTIRIGLTIPIGGGSAKAPLNSFAGSIINPRHNAVSSLALSTF